VIDAYPTSVDDLINTWLDGVEPGSVEDDPDWVVNSFVEQLTPADVDKLPDDFRDELLNLGYQLP
jgi:hypothetical protein